MVAAAGLVMRRGPYGAAATSALILGAAVLKLFPIAAIGMLTGLPRRLAVVCTAAVGGIFTLYAAATYRDIRTIQRVLPQDDEYAYGLHIFGGWLDRSVGLGRTWDVLIVVLTLVLAIALRRKLRHSGTFDPSRELDLFCAGAGIYAATFVLLRSADYRLVFLLLTVPQLLRWAAAGRALAITTLVAVLLTLWLPSEWSNVPIVNDLVRRWNDLTRAGADQLPLASPAQLVAFVGLTCLLAAVLQANWDREPAGSLQRDAPSARMST
jgi:hypothetical protein